MKHLKGPINIKVVTIYYNGILKGVISLRKLINKLIATTLVHGRIIKFKDRSIVLLPGTVTSNLENSHFKNEYEHSL